MKTARHLSLYHEVTLLALKDEKGTVESGAYILPAIGAAILSELLLSGRVEIESEGKKSFTRVVSTEVLGDDLLDECLQRIHASKKRHKLQTWVTRFSNTKNLRHRVALDLCARGVLRASQDKVMFVFKRRIYPEIHPKPEREIVARLKKAIFGAGPVDPRTVALVAIAQAANLLKNAVDRKRLKDRKERIKRITSGEATGRAAKDVIEAAQAAAAISVIIAASVVTHSASR